MNLPQNFSSKIPLSISEPVYSFAISGNVHLENDASFIRAVLVAKDSHEYLIYETYTSLTDADQFSEDNVCEETCALDAILPVELRIEGNSASLDITATNISTDVNSLKLNGKSITILSKKIKDDKDKNKIQTLNRLINQKGKKWIAGETSVSKLTYAEKKKLFGDGSGKPLEILPNLQGFEFYKSGVFEVKNSQKLTLLSTNPTTPTPQMSTPLPTPITVPASTAYQPPAVFFTPTPTPPPPPPTPTPQTPTPTTIPTPFDTQYPLSWDWRNRHGTSWITPVRDQLWCASCWAFSAIGSVESVINIYYNQLLNIDLSEQDSVCKHPGSCSYGGSPWSTLNELKSEGLVTELCYPYTGDEECSGRCTGWVSNLWKITGFDSVSTPDEEIKSNLIKKGPIAFGVSSWWHGMVLVGYEVDANYQNVWFLKNSWGMNWGENGFVRLVVPEYDRYLLFYSEQPYFSQKPDSYKIACVDKDRDGYCNWGISETKPDSCSRICYPQKDCDDSNASLGSYDSKYNCTVIP